MKVHDSGGERVAGVVHDFPMRPNGLGDRRVLLSDNVLDTPADFIQLVGGNLVTVISPSHVTEPQLLDCLPLMVWP